MQKLLAAALLLTALGTGRAQSVQAIPVDEIKLHGTWYEVARYPSKNEKGCVSDVIELIARSEKKRTLQWVDACKAKDGNTLTHNVLAKPDKHGEGKFTTTHFFLFHRHYWVLAIDPEYQWSVVGSPDRKSLWVFSRVPVLQPDAFDAIFAKAAAEGFPKGPLIHTKQTPLPGTTNVTTPPNAVSPGPTPANPVKPQAQ